MARITTRPITDDEMRAGTDAFLAAPYSAMTEAQVRAAMHDQGIRAAAQYGWPLVNDPVIRKEVDDMMILMGVKPTPAPTSEPPAPEPPSPEPPPAGNPAEGLTITDKVNRPKTAVTKPARLGTWVDPQFGTTFRRITDVASQWPGATVAKPAYATVPAWNADESLMIIYVTNSTVGHILLNGHTYEPIREISWSLTDLEHFMWSATDPDTCYYVTAQEQSGTSIRELRAYHPSTNNHELVYAIPNATQAQGYYRVDFGGDPIYCSYDNLVFGFRARGSSDKGFTYKIGVGESARINNTDAPQIAPSGTICIAANTAVAPIDLSSTIRNLTVDGVEHGSMMRLRNGNDVWATVQFDDIEGTLVVENLTTGAVKTLVGPSTGYPYPPTGTHISGHAFQAPGFVAVSCTGNSNPMGSTLLAQELLLVDVDNEIVYRVGRHRSDGGDAPQGYWAEPHVNISPSGTRMLFGSDWGSGSTVDAYVLELPSYVAP